MYLDVFKVCRIFECIIIPIKLLHPFVDGRISVTDCAEIALEMINIDRIEPNNRHPESHVSFCEFISN